MHTVVPSIPRIANDAEQVNAAELDKPDPALATALTSPKFAVRISFSNHAEVWHTRTNALHEKPFLHSTSNR